MLRVQHLIRDLIPLLVPVLARIRRHDRDLENQLRRALTSVPLNVGEGFGLRDGNKRLRYLTALGSHNELVVGLDVAVAFGYIAPLEPHVGTFLEDIAKMFSGLAKR